MTAGAAGGKPRTSRLGRLLQFDRQMRLLCQESAQLSLTLTSAAGSGIPVRGGDLVVIGLDEVGRGCLAGPVVAAAVALPPVEKRSDLAASLSRLNDSKAISGRERNALAAVIHSVATCAIAEASVEEIDEMNILQASLLAMRRAYSRLSVTSNVVLLVDGNRKIPGLAERQMTVVRGDSRSATIASASIIAKVYRDALMCKLAEAYPQYQWHKNKGYGSREHLHAIKEIGLSPWHRKSFSVKL